MQFLAKVFRAGNIKRVCDSICAILTLYRFYLPFVQQMRAIYFRFRSNISHFKSKQRPFISLWYSFFRNWTKLFEIASLLFSTDLFDNKSSVGYVLVKNCFFDGNWLTLIDKTKQRRLLNKLFACKLWSKFISLMLSAN